MHPSQMSAFRKTIIICLTAAFAGTLLVFTAQANLDLLRAIYPDPKFYMFGLLALEGGTIYWMGYYLLHLSGAHKALAIFALVIDAILSGTGFFYEMEMHTNSVGTVQLPPVIIIVGFAILFNVGWSLLCHLIPSGAAPAPSPAPRPKEERDYSQGYAVQTFEQRAETSRPAGPGLIKNAAAGAIAAAQDIMDLAREKREEKRRQRQVPPAQVQVQEEPESPKSEASLVESQAN
jgi:hypothetical protein